MRFKSQTLTRFTLDLRQAVQAIRGPQVKTARNLFALPILEPQSEAWFAQNLDDFLAAYDWTVPMAMPLMESVPIAASQAWLTRLVQAVARHPGALKKPSLNCRPETGIDASKTPFPTSSWRTGCVCCG